MTKVLIIDDHPIVLQGFRRLVEEHGACAVFVASKFLEAFVIYRQEQPDMLIVDLSVARRSLAGLGFIKRLRTVDKRVPILVFSMHGDPAIVRRALSAGATGYVHKDAPPTEIGIAYEKVRDGQRFIASDLAVEVALLPPARSGAALNDFTRREQEILSLLAEGQAYGEIAEELGLSYKTVANVCSILKSKLDADTLPDLIYKAVQKFGPRQSRR